MKRVILIVSFLAAAGCDRAAKEPDAKHVESAGNTETRKATNDVPAENTEARKATNDVPADNTDKNERDRSGSTLTPGDQGTSPEDRTITQQVRQGVVKDDALSMNAKNVKIITVGGVVTLRGPVKSNGEKSTISTIAKDVEGVKRVDNQLEIAAN